MVRVTLSRLDADDAVIIPGLLHLEIDILDFVAPPVPTNASCPMLSLGTLVDSSPNKTLPRELRQVRLLSLVYTHRTKNSLSFLNEPHPFALFPFTLQFTL